MIFRINSNSISFLITFLLAARNILFVNLHHLYVDTVKIGEKARSFIPTTGSLIPTIITHPSSNKSLKSSSSSLGNLNSILIRGFTGEKNLLSTVSSALENKYSFFFKTILPENNVSTTRNISTRVFAENHRFTIKTREYETESDHNLLSEQAIPKKVLLKIFSRYSSHNNNHHYMNRYDIVKGTDTPPLLVSKGSLNHLNLKNSLNRSGTFFVPKVGKEGNDIRPQLQKQNETHIVLGNHTHNEMGETDSTNAFVNKFYNTKMTIKILEGKEEVRNEYKSGSFISQATNISSGQETSSTKTQDPEAAKSDGKKSHEFSEPLQAVLLVVLLDKSLNTFLAGTTENSDTIEISSTPTILTTTRAAYEIWIITLASFSAIVTAVLLLTQIASFTSLATGVAVKVRGKMKPQCYNNNCKKSVRGVRGCFGIPVVLYAACYLIFSLIILLKYILWPSPPEFNPSLLIKNSQSLEGGHFCEYPINLSRCLFELITVKEALSNPLSSLPELGGKVTTNHNKKVNPTEIFDDHMVSRNKNNNYLTKIYDHNYDLVHSNLYDFYSGGQFRATNLATLLAFYFEGVASLWIATLAMEYLESISSSHMNDDSITAANNKPTTTFLNRIRFLKMHRAKKFEMPTKKEVRNQNNRMYWLLQITTWALPGFCVLAFSTLSRSMINGIFRDPNCTLLIDSDNNLNDNFAHLPCCHQVNNSQKKHFCPCFLVFLSSPVSSINDTTTRLLNRRMEDFSDSSTLTTPNYLTFEIQPKFFLHVLLIVPTILAVLFSIYFLARYQYGIRFIDRRNNNNNNSLPKQQNSSSPPSTITPTITETSVPTCPKQQGQQLKQHRSFKVTIFVTLFVVLKGVMIFILILNTATTTTSTSISTAKNGWNKEIQCYLLNPKKFFVVFKTLYYYYYYYYVNNNSYSLSSDGPFDSSRQAPELGKFTATINSSYISNPITNSNITFKPNLFKDNISSYCSPSSGGIKFIIDHHHQIADPQQHLGLHSLNSRLVAFTYSSVIDNLDLTSFFSLSCGILTVIWLFNEQVIEVWTNVVSKIFPFPIISKAFKNCLFHHTTTTLRGRKRHEYFPFEYKSRHNKLLSSQTFKPEISMRFWQTTTTTKDIKYMELIQQRVSTDQEMSKKTSSTPFNREYEKEQILININKKIVPRLSYHQIQIYNEKTISVKTRETVSYPHIRPKTNGQSTNTKWASTSNTFATPSWTREPQSFNLLKRAKNGKCQHHQVDDEKKNIKSNLACTNQNCKIKILKFASMYEHNGCGNHSHLGTRKVKHNDLEICQATRYWHRFKSSKPTAKSHFAHNVNQNPKGLDRCFTNDPHKYSKHIDSLVHITYLKHTKNKLTMYDH